ncbi:ubiquinol--cytochrome-c reductase catalytic subunit rip1 [Mycoemilia scoparia]|uniref:Cytochrome b-c1 complex subunit Rieske, mitochondrial n=1 Tax=Mycoemilia scoparia TaxID=417184 RepID=A0A9W8A1U2_9FUNG|nr:ubiquinol--cytochrome-c reductase catalytic subunit rip1 [Mycoemilia scoparia]
MALPVKISASVINRTFFSTPNTTAAVKAVGATAAAKFTTHKSASKSSAVSITSASRTITNFTSSPKNIGYQQRFSSGFAAGPGSEKVPSFGDYTKERTNDSSRAFTYFMLGASGTVVAATAQSAVHGFLMNMSASADVLAMAKVEVDLNNIPLGKTVTIKWRGKPVFVKHRTQEEIDEANSVTIKSLPDPQVDADRTQTPEWLVVVGICTHLGCVPISDSGDFGGWYCPCHGSHYDVSGRIRKGPAPLNLEVPEYTIDGSTMVIG